MALFDYIRNRPWFMGQALILQRRYGKKPDYPLLKGQVPARSSFDGVHSDVQSRPENCIFQQYVVVILMEPRLVKIGEAARILGSTPGALRKWEATGNCCRRGRRPAGPGTTPWPTFWECAPKTLQRYAMLESAAMIRRPTWTPLCCAGGVLRRPGLAVPPDQRSGQRYELPQEGVQSCP